MRQTVLRLAFSEPLQYGQNGVYGIPKISFIFNYLGEIFGQKSEMVQLESICLNSLFDTLQEWETHLVHSDLNDQENEYDKFSP